MELMVNKNVGVKNIRGFYDSLGEALKNSDSIVINFSRVDRIDLSVLTVLSAAYREIKGNGKMIKLKNVSPRLKEQLYISGFMT